MKELGVSKERCVICYNGLDIDESFKIESQVRSRAAVLRKEKNPGDLPLFLYVGGILPKKRVDLLIKAFCDLRKERDALLWIIGDGPVMNDVQQAAAELGAEGITFFGRIIDDVDVYFAAADYFVLPGIGGLALNQAMFWETPCICSEADGTEADLVLDGETGFAFEKDNEKALLAAMKQAVDLRHDREAYSKMAGEGRGLIEARSNSDKILETFYAEYQKRIIQCGGKPCLII